MNESATYYGEHQAEDAMSVLARWMGQNNQVRVVYHNGTAVDADIYAGVIRIPRMACASGITQEALMLLRARVYHEAGHIDETKLPKSEYPKGALHEIWNALEDRRMESVEAGKHKGCEIVFRWGNHHFNRKIAEQMVEKKTDAPLWEALVAMSLMVEGLQPAWALGQKAQDYVDAAYPEFIKVKQCKNAKEVLELAKVIYKLLKDVNEDWKNSQPPQEPQKGKPQKGEKGEGEKQKGQSGEGQSGDEDDEENDQTGEPQQGGSRDFDDYEKEGKKPDEGQSGEGQSGDEEGEGEPKEGGQGQDGDEDGDDKADGKKSGKKDDKKDGKEEGKGKGKKGDAEKDQGQDGDEQGDEGDEGQDGKDGDKGGEGKEKGDGVKGAKGSDEGDEGAEGGSEGGEGSGEGEGEENGPSKNDPNGKESKGLPNGDVKPGDSPYKPQEQAPKGGKGDGKDKRDLEDEMDGMSREQAQNEDLEDFFKNMSEEDKQYTSRRDLDYHSAPQTSEEDKTSYRERISQVSVTVASMTRALEQALRSLSKCRKNPYLRQGKIDHRRLVTIAKNLSKEVFYRTREGMKLDVAVAITIDESGSMANFYSVQLLAMAIGEALNAIGIPFEIVGTTTAYGGGDRRMPSMDYFTRVNPIIYKHYKNFGEQWVNVRHRMVHTGAHHHNVDGEVVEYAAFRLAQRPESRKVIFSLSDGEPCAGHGNDATMGQNLKRVCNRVRKQGIEVYGFGVGTMTPKTFYGAKWFVGLMDVMKMGPEFVREFVKIVTEGKVKV